MRVPESSRGGVAFVPLPLRLAKRPVNEPPISPPLAVKAMRLFAVVTSIVLQMLVPLLVGVYVDRWLGMNWAWFVGLGVGIPLATWHLVRLVKSEFPDRRPGPKPPP